MPASTRSTPSITAQIPFDLDVSPDGQLVSASFGEVNGKQTVRVWKIADLSPTAIPRRSRARSSRRRSRRLHLRAGRQGAVGTSYYTGVSNIYRFDIATQKYDALSNASTGFFRPHAAARRIAARLRI